MKPPKKPGGKPPKTPPNTNEQIRFVRYFIHWRTGKLMDAFEYGHRGWPIGGGK